MGDLISGFLRAPYHILIRQSPPIGDAEILQHFRLFSYQRSPRPLTSPHVVFADADEWKLLADDWYYSRWNDPATRPLLRTLAQRHEIYACSVGDCDRSFDFVYFRKGELRRKYVVESPRYNDQVVRENIGDPLPGEAEWLPTGNEDRIGLEIAERLGIRTRFAAEELRWYGASGDADARPVFSPDGAVIRNF